MAEFLTEGRKRRAMLLSTDPRSPDELAADCFAAMGKPVPWTRRERAVTHCKSMGMTDMASITHCVGNMAEALERDKPYEAMQAGCVWLDLTGTYRLMAVLLTDE